MAVNCALCSLRPVAQATSRNPLEVIKRQDMPENTFRATGITTSTLSLGQERWGARPLLLSRFILSSSAFMFYCACGCHRK